MQLHFYARQHLVSSCQLLVKGTNAKPWLQYVPWWWQWCQLKTKTIFLTNKLPLPPLSLISIYIKPSDVSPVAAFQEKHQLSKTEVLIWCHAVSIWARGDVHTSVFTFSKHTYMQLAGFCCWDVINDPIKINDKSNYDLIRKLALLWLLLLTPTDGTADPGCRADYANGPLYCW